MRRVPTNTATSSSLPGPGELRHQPRRIHLTVDALPDGRLRIRTGGCRGWAAIARNPQQLAHVVGRAFTEEAVASYSAWRRQRYDLDRLTAPDDPDEPARRAVGRPRPVESEQVSYGRRRIVRPDQSAPGDWTPEQDGRWRSPSGKRYRSRRIIEPLLARRAQLGLPLTWEEAQQRATRRAS